MAPDLLSTICREIEDRLNELRPLLAEYERLLVAADALVATGHEGSSEAGRKARPTRDARRGARVLARRGSAAGAIKLAATDSAETTVEVGVDGDLVDVRRTAVLPRRPAAKPKPERATRGAAREAILAALGHGSHTVGELVIVTAMSGPNINGNLRKLVSEGAVVKTEREGKAAWALSGAVN
jgi:DNA-binding transcriptional ArsR family regulator